MKVCARIRILWALLILHLTRAERCRRSRPAQRVVTGSGNGYALMAKNEAKTVEIAKRNSDSSESWLDLAVVEAAVTLMCSATASRPARASTSRRSVESFHGYQIALGNTRQNRTTQGCCVMKYSLRPSHCKEVGSMRALAVPSHTFGFMIRLIRHIFDGTYSTAAPQLILDAGFSNSAPVQDIKRLRINTQESGRLGEGKVP